MKQQRQQAPISTDHFQKVKIKKATEAPSNGTGFWSIAFYNILTKLKWKVRQT